MFNARTGRSLRKTVQSMEEKNARTGSLRRAAGRGYTGTLARSGGIGKSGSLSKRFGKVRKADMNELIQPPSRPTEALQTEQKNTSSMETQVLSSEDLVPTLEQIQKEADQSYGMFRIEKYTMLIHTDEMV